MFSNTIDQLLQNPDFMAKIASKYPAAVRANISRSTGMSGSLDEDFYKIAYTIGSKAYFQRRERALINTGLIALSEVKNG